MPKPFDYVNSINQKKDIMQDDVDEKAYSQYLVNRAFSYFPETVMWSNELNCLQGISNRAHYDYMLNIPIPKAKRYSKWYKPKEDEDLKAIMEYYVININKAKDYNKILSREQKDNIIEYLKKE